MPPRSAHIDENEQTLWRGAALLGYLVFGGIPDFWTWVGAGAIVCSGLYLGHVERQRHRALIKK